MHVKKEDSNSTESVQKPLEQKPISCNICQQLFKSQNDLYRHKLTHLKKNVTNPEDEKISCNICQQLFDGKNDLLRHKLTHLKKNTTVKDEEAICCNICSKQFDSKNEVLKHKLTHFNKSVLIKQEDENEASENLLDSNIEVTNELFRCPVASCEFTTSHPSLMEGDGVRHLIKIHNIYPSKMIKSGLKWTKIL